MKTAITLTEKDRLAFMEAFKEEEQMRKNCPLNRNGPNAFDIFVLALRYERREIGKLCDDRSNNSPGAMLHALGEIRERVKAGLLTRKEFMDRQEPGSYEWTMDELRSMRDYAASLKKKVHP